MVLFLDFRLDLFFVGSVGGCVAVEVEAWATDWAKTMPCTLATSCSNLNSAVFTLRNISICVCCRLRIWQRKLLSTFVNTAGVGFSSRFTQLSLLVPVLLLVESQNSQGRLDPDSTESDRPVPCYSAAGWVAPPSSSWPSRFQRLSLGSWQYSRNGCGGT